MHQRYQRCFQRNKTQIKIFFSLSFCACGPSHAEQPTLTQYLNGSHSFVMWVSFFQAHTIMHVVTTSQPMTMAEWQPLTAFRPSPILMNRVQTVILSQSHSTQWIDYNTNIKKILGGQLGTHGLGYADLGYADKSKEWLHLNNQVILGQTKFLMYKNNLLTIGLNSLVKICMC